MTTLSDGKAWLLAIVEAALERTDYHAEYVARVVAQGGNGLLSVVPDDKRIPPMVDVPIRYGVPGISAKVESGARVLIGFEGGDRRRPIATVWESAALTELRITSTTKVVLDCPDVELGDEGGAPVARLGDVVDLLITAADIAAAVANPTAPVIQAVGLISSAATRTKAS